MPRLLLLLCLLALSSTCRADDFDKAYAADFAKSTLAREGELAPLFVGRDSSGAEWRLADQKGRVVLVNFFATWCQPCLKELPHLEKEVWGAFKDKGLVLVSIGREHSVEEVAAFKGKMKLSYPMLADPGRAIYKLYATQYIPRCVLIGKDGKIVAVTDVYAPKTFEVLLGKIRAELAR
jgi:peroxiredoxin